MSDTLCSSGTFHLNQYYHFFDAPDVISYTRFHRRSNPQSLMHAAEVVVHVEKRDCPHMILDFLGERIRQASKAAHFHPHREILAPDMAG